MPKPLPSKARSTSRWPPGPTTCPTAATSARAGDADGIEGHMARRAFTLKARPSRRPAGGPRAGEKTTDEQVTLAWARNPQAARYRLQVAPSADFATPSIARDDLAETELRWCCRWARRTIGKMCAADGDQGPWGDARARTRGATAVSPPPSAPGSQSSKAATRAFAVNWAAAPLPGATYQVQIARRGLHADRARRAHAQDRGALLAKPDAGTTCARAHDRCRRRPRRRLR
ncbi:MAG: hypothetical protein U1F67_20280 [Rubrivivax sp.]